MGYSPQWYEDYLRRHSKAAQEGGPTPELHAGVDREADLHSEIIAHCKSKGWIYFHGSMAHKAMRTVGEPDFTILADNGRVFFVEAKTKDGKLTAEQLGLKMWAEKLGHMVWTVRSMEMFRDITK